MYDAEHAALFDSIRVGVPLNNGDYMAGSTMLGTLGQMVCYTGKQITWEEAMSSQYTLGPAEVSFDTEPPVKPDGNGIYPVAMPGVTTCG